MNDLTIKFLTPPDSIADAQSVRTQVFQEEQGIDRNLDFDGRDNVSTHIVVYKDGTPVGTGRIRKIDDNKVKIERVSVLSEMRGQGIGKLIMKKIDEYISDSQIPEATLDAQFHAKGFYESLGYQQEGDVFEEVGIPHVIMTKKFK